MSTLDLSRWQFGITTVYHFIFVPLTIGLSIVVACLQTAWFIKKDPAYLRLTKFFGKLFLINFAVGVVTGIVQEFQFGMNWSAYSKFVGDVFGAPLAMEALLAFFMESTFLGLWIFGWDKLSPRIHLATIWLAAFGTSLSAYFILAANAWMQHPVGYAINPVTHRAQLTSIVALLTNSTALAAWPHVFFASFLITGAVVIAIAAWNLMRGRETAIFRRVMRFGLVITLLAAIATAITGDIQARLMDSQQPMKMAAAEALYNTESPASFSLFTIGSLNGNKEVWSVRVPYLLSLIATLDPHGTVKGIDNVERAYVKKYGPGDYRPYVPVTYWSFRLMIGFGMLGGLIALAGLWLTRRRRIPKGTLFYQIAMWGVVVPYLGTTSGWLFTEMGRQPWTVFGVLKTQASVSAGVTPSSVIISMTVFTLLYATLAVIAGKLAFRHVKDGLPADSDDSAAAKPLPVFSY
ncbi:MAG TPA: cytochrome ubiquinol oxidase subunit I [Streptosporangiaceae bacterium]|nr:cytochrome ubiquinol oxidase subunit I [Streptosporangiaceae bacterium]